MSLLCGLLLQTAHMQEESMIQTVYCDGCGQSGALPVRLAYQYSNERCGECRHSDSKEFAYYFCSLECFGSWVSHRYQVGPEEMKTEVARFPMNLPCRIEWAHQAGNDTKCPACGGKKFVD